jgi:hypothetical protein
MIGHTPKGPLRQTQSQSCFSWVKISSSNSKTQTYDLKLSRRLNAMKSSRTSSHVNTWRKCQVRISSNSTFMPLMSRRGFCIKHGHCNSEITLSLLQLTTIRKCCGIRCCSTRHNDRENYPLIRRLLGGKIQPSTTRDKMARTWQEDTMTVSVITNALAHITEILNLESKCTLMFKVSRLQIIASALQRGITPHSVG